MGVIHDNQCHKWLVSDFLGHMLAEAVILPRTRLA